MAEAFGTAAKRHWDDAELLFKEDRVTNSGYLAGYVVECSLKWLVEATEISPKSLSHDLTALSGDALSLATLLTPSLARYTIPDSAELTDIIAGWSPELRYTDNATISKAKAQAWLRAAEQVYLAVVVKLVLDGRGAV